ncbi:MAG: acyltransferase 3 [Bacillota bacterium]|jgi:surface polysaccharide O-acyltransferase-like enzyme|nr:acyltransferase 3 [Bacillota bacterium]
MILNTAVKEVKEIKEKNTAQNNRLYELDYIRFIACLAVIIVHITATGVTDYIQGSFPHIVTLILNRSLKFTTPVFIFLSGVTNFYSYDKKELKYIDFVKKRLKSTLIPYFVWCCIYYLAYIYAGIYKFDIIFFMKNVILGTMSYHLYFVIIITQIYLLGPLFYKLIKNSKNKIFILIIGAVFTAICAGTLNFKLSDRIFLKYIFFYMLGIYVTLETEKFKTFVSRNKILIASGYIAIGILYTLATYYNWPEVTYIWFVFSAVSVFLVFLLSTYLVEIFKNKFSYVKLFGQSSYYIYLMHPLVLTVMIMLAAKYGIISVTARLVLYFLVVIPATIGSCIIYTVIKNKIKKAKKSKKALLLSNK